MTIKELRKIEGIGRLLQVYSVKAQGLTDSKESAKLDEVICTTAKELWLIAESIPMQVATPEPLPIESPVVIDQATVAADFMRRVSEGEDVGICESCQG